MQGHDLVGNFQHQVGTTSSHSNHSSFCWVIPGPVSLCSAPRSPGWGWGGWGSRALSNTSPACVLSPRKLLSCLHLWRGITLFSLRGSLSPLSPPAEQTFPLPSSCRRGAAGQTLRLRGGAGRSPGPLPSGSLAGAAQLIAVRVRGRRRTQQGQVKCRGVLALPKNPPSLLSLPPSPSFPLSLFRLNPLRVSSLHVAGFFSEVPRAWLQGGGWALTEQGLISKTYYYEVSFLVISLQIRQWLHQDE